MMYSISNTHRTDPLSHAIFLRLAWAFGLMLVGAALELLMLL